MCNVNCGSKLYFKLLFEQNKQPEDVNLGLGILWHIIDQTSDYEFLQPFKNILYIKTHTICTH